MCHALEQHKPKEIIVLYYRESKLPCFAYFKLSQEYLNTDVKE